MSPILMGTLGGLIAALATAAGALPAMFGKKMSQQWTDTTLGFAAGVMLSASYFSLILPGIDAAEDIYGSLTIAAAVAGLGIALGASTRRCRTSISRPGARAPRRAGSRGSGFS